MLAQLVHKSMHRTSSGLTTGHDSFFGGVLRALQKRMRREQYETWFHGFRLESVSEEAAEFTVPSVFVRDWLLKNYHRDIAVAVEQVAGTPREVRITLDDSRRSEASSRQSPLSPISPASQQTSPTSQVSASHDGVEHGGPGQGVPGHGGPGHGGPGRHGVEDAGLAAEREIAAEGDLGSNGVDPAVEVGGDGSLAMEPEFAPSPVRASGRSSAGTWSVSIPSDGVRRDPYLTKLNKDYVFDQYVVGGCNRLAYAACVGVGENPGRNYNPLFIHGNVGLGKTHLLQATCHAILRKQREARVLYLSCEDFTNRFIKAIQDHRVDDFRELHRSVDILVIDDVQFLAGKERTQDEFFHTFNALYNANRQIVISSDRPPLEIPTIEERLVSRFKWGLVVEMEKPDFETRVAIVKRKGRVRGVEFGDDVAHFIAERVNSNIRELEGAVVKVVGMAALVEREITVELAQEALQGVRVKQKRNQVGLPDIMQLITREFSISAKEICGKRRTQAVSLPRQIGMYLSREATEHSLEEIGRFFGNRDHTTVLYAVTKIKNRSKDDRMFRDLLKNLNQQLMV